MMMFLMAQRLIIRILKLINNPLMDKIFCMFFIHVNYKNLQQWQITMKKIVMKNVI